MTDHVSILHRHVSNSSASSSASTGSTSSIPAAPIRAPVYVLNKSRPLSSPLHEAALAQWNSQTDDETRRVRENSLSSVRTLTPMGIRGKADEMPALSRSLYPLQRKDSNHSMVSTIGSIAPFKKTLNDFEIHEVLGEGSYSTVHRCVELESSQRARRDSWAPIVEGEEQLVAIPDSAPIAKEYAIKILSKRQLIRENKVKYATVERDALTLLNSAPQVQAPYAHPNSPMMAKAWSSLSVSHKSTVALIPVDTDQDGSVSTPTAAVPMLASPTSRSSAYVERSWDTGQEGIIKLMYTLHNETNLYFILELAPKGDLLALLRIHGSFDLKSAQFYTAQILAAIGYMHTRGVLHRDIKPQNILLDANMNVKITDFGSARILSPVTSPDSPSQLPTTATANSFVGTAEYVSPELLKDKTAMRSSDIWAFGCCLFQIIAGRPPFKAPNDYLTFQKILKLEYTIPDQFPSGATDLVQKILVLNSEERPTSLAIADHPFFEGIDFDCLWRTIPPPIVTGIKSPAQDSKAWSEKDWPFEGAADGASDCVESDDELEDDRRQSRDTTTRSQRLRESSMRGDLRATPSETFSEQSNTSRSSLNSSRQSSEHWQSILLDKEHVLLESQGHLRSTTLIPIDKKRLFALTDLPRVVGIRTTSTSWGVRFEINLDTRPDLIKVEAKGSRGVLVHTPARIYHMLLKDGATAQIWLEQMRACLVQGPLGH